MADAEDDDTLHGQERRGDQHVQHADEVARRTTPPGSSMPLETRSANELDPNPAPCTRDQAQLREHAASKSGCYPLPCTSSPS
eukprot:1264106-Rhodomonas_salina.3